MLFIANLDPISFLCGIIAAIGFFLAGIGAGWLSNQAVKWRDRRKL